METHFDALVVGTGFSGIYQLYSLLKMGLRCHAIDVAGDVGGAWYWNRYPGAMSDTHSFVYRYSFDKDDLHNYPWPNNYLAGGEIQSYLNHVVEKYGLRKHMQFNTELVFAEWSEEAKKWTACCSNGEVFVVQYLLLALGQLSKKLIPDIPGLKRTDMKMKVVHSASWGPDVDVRGKRKLVPETRLIASQAPFLCYRATSTPTYFMKAHTNAFSGVGIIGNGSSGVQIATAISDCVEELRCFIRHPQYTVPAGLRPVTAEERQMINHEYDEIWERCWKSATGFGFTESSRPTMSVSAEEREEIFEKLWKVSHITLWSPHASFPSLGNFHWWRQTACSPRAYHPKIGIKLCLLT